MRVLSVNPSGLVNYPKTNATKQKRNLKFIETTDSQAVSFKNQQLKSAGVKLAKMSVGTLAGLGLGVLTGGAGLLLLPGLGLLAGAIKGDYDDRRDHPENYDDDDYYDPPERDHGL